MNDSNAATNVDLKTLGAEVHCYASEIDFKTLVVQVDVPDGINVALDVNDCRTITTQAGHRDVGLHSELTVTKRL